MKSKVLRLIRIGGPAHDNAVHSPAFRAAVIGLAGAGGLEAEGPIQRAGRVIVGGDFEEDRGASGSM